MLFKKNTSLLSLGCSTATQSHGNTRIVSSQTSTQYISSCKLMLPHKEMINILPGNYMTWTSPLQSCIVCRSILLDAFCFPRCVFFLDLATFWNLYRPLSWINPFCTWKCFLFFSGSGFPLCEHHIRITSQYDQIALLNFQRIQEEHS